MIKFYINVQSLATFLAFFLTGDVQLLREDHLVLLVGDRHVLVLLLQVIVYLYVIYHFYP